MNVNLDAKLKGLSVLAVFAYFLLMYGTGQATPLDSNCLISHSGTGCDDAQCQTTICAMDSYCCDTLWDQVCAEEAYEGCEFDGPLPSIGDCLEYHETKGCNDPQCEASVCAVDSYCCENYWDNICVEEAEIYCPQYLPPKGGCCMCNSAGQYMTVDTEAGCTDFGGNYLGDGTAEPVVVDSSPNIPIPDADLNGVSNTITMTESFPIADLNVGLNITHEYVGDLTVTLSKAGGPSVVLIETIPCGLPDFNNIILDDEGQGGSIQQTCTVGLSSPPNYIPANLLIAFDGLDSAGDWTLTVKDNFGSDTGVLVSWSLYFTDPSPCAETFPDQCAAYPARLFGTTGYGGTSSTLIEIEPYTGTVLNTIGPVGYTVNGLAYDATTDTLYGSTSVNDPIFNGLITIDMATGEGTPVGSNYWGGTTADAVTNITVNSAGQMYGWSEGSYRLVSIDKTTGVATEVGPSGISTMACGLSFNNEDILYLVNDSSGYLYRVDTSNGEVFLVGSFGEFAHHGDFHPETDLYYGLSMIWGDPTRYLLECDLAMQQCTTVGAPISGLHTLAFVWAGTTDVNHPPVAEAGQDQWENITHDGDPASGTASITLDGSASSDPDGDSLTYSWKSEDVEIATGVNPTVDMPVGEYYIILTVTDPDGATSSDIVVITLMEPNTGPTVNAGTDQEVTSSGGTATVTLDGSGSNDPDGDSLTYSWAEGGTVIATGVSPTVNLADGTHVITLTATDPYGAGDTDEVKVTVSPPAADSALDISNIVVARRNAKVITVTMLITNPADAKAYNVTVNGGTLDGSDTNSSLPLVFGIIKQGKSKQCTLQFKDVPAGVRTFTVEGTSSLGGFFSETSVTVP